VGGGAGNAGAFRGSDRFAIDIAEARAFRDIQRRLTVLLRKRYGPRENGGPLTATEILEESELDAAIGKSAATLVCPPGYGPGDAVNDSNQLHQLNCKRLSPPSCGGGELKGADDEEEAFLTVRVAAFQHSPEGRDRRRMLALKLKGVSGCRSPEEQKELDHLKVVYPEGPSESALPKAIELKLSSLGN